MSKPTSTRSTLLEHVGRASGPAALLIALLALLVAVSGTSFAAAKLAKNSVGTRQLKAGAVTGVKVKDGSLTSRDFAPGQLPAGPAGPAGPTGATGSPGLSGFQRVSSQISAGGSTGGSAAATCPAGTVVVGGTGGSSSTAAYVSSTGYSADGSSWFVEVRADNGSTLPAGTTIRATAFCARVS